MSASGRVFEQHAAAWGHRPTIAVLDLELAVEHDRELTSRAGYGSVLRTSLGTVTNMSSCTGRGCDTKSDGTF
jgi:hypothetical protein